MASVLIIDDDLSVHQLVTTLLEGAGHGARSATSGEMGLQLLDAERFDLVLLDMKLPGMSGPDVLAVIRERRLDVGVVCFTAFATVRQGVQCIQNGAFDYIEKPFQAGEFLSVVERALGAVCFRRAQAHKSRELEDHFGSPSLAIGDTPIERDVRPAGELLGALASLLSASLPGSKRDARSPELWRQELVAAVVKGLTSDASAPVFWAFARSLRIFASPARTNLLVAAEEVQTMVRQAVELVLNARPKTRTIVNHLEVRMASSRILSLQQFCQELQVNRNYLSRLLKVDTGLNFRQWRWAIIMRAAARQLAASDEHVRQIAFGSGYEYPSQFDRDFGRVFGMSPVQFRRLAQQT